jgi:hypothetical protein
MGISGPTTVEARMSSSESTVRTGAAGSAHYPPLRSPGEISLPVSKRVLVTASSLPALDGAVVAALTSGGFAAVRESAETHSESDELSVQSGTPSHFGERRVRRVATSSSIKASVGILIAAGALLGVIDAFVVGSAVLLIPWLGVGLGASGFIWLRYGRTYQSELIAVVPVPTPPSDEADGPAAAVTLLWSVGRIRSVGYGGSRTSLGVQDCPVALIETFTSVVRKFESELGKSGAPDGPSPVGSGRARA